MTTGIPPRLPGAPVSDDGPAAPTDPVDAAATVPHVSSSVTDWEVIHTAGGDGPASRAAVEAIARRYWPALYGFLRRSGRDAEVAGDLTQGFLADVMLGSDLLQRADPGRGRFRALLFASLRNYVIQRHRHDTRLRRAPREGVRSLDPALGESMIPAAAGDDPERIFDLEWSRALVRTVLQTAEGQCDRSGLGIHWRIFHARVVDPMLHGAAPRAYEELVSEFELADVSTAANMMITAKRRFVRALRAEIARTVSDPEMIDPEIRELLSSLGGGG